MSAKHLVVGLDGMDLDVVRAIGAGRLPTLHRLMARGTFAHLESVQPPATLPNWTTFLTGVDPGVHGVFDFTTRRGYRVRFTAGTVRAAPTIAARLDALGHVCACLFFPATYPPERLSRGIFMSGWDAPVAFDADRSFVWPPSLHDDIRERFGTVRFDDVDELAADTPGWHARLPAALEARIAKKTALAAHLLGDRAWDLFMVYFGESDTASHYLWSLHDATSPRRPPHVSPEDADGLARVYAALDAALAELLETAGGDEVELTVVSDHGSGGSSNRVLHLNRALQEAGLLRFRERGLVQSAVTALKEVALTRLPPLVRDRAFRAAGTILPSLLESAARFGAIDFAHTVAFSDELNYFPAVHLNVRGREPAGTVDPIDVPKITRDVTDALLALRDPWTDSPVVAAVTPRDELFRGPHVARAPDLLLTLHLTSTGHSYNLMPSAAAPPGTGPWRTLDASEHLGRKGRSLPGSHRPRGIYIAHGPRVATAGEIDARIADATATLLARMDVAVPHEAAGRVLYEALTETAGADADAGPAPRALPDVKVPDNRVADESRILARLRALGYVD